MDPKIANGVSRRIFDRFKENRESVREIDQQFGEIFNSRKLRLKTSSEKTQSQHKSMVAAFANNENTALLLNDRVKKEHSRSGTSDQTGLALSVNVEHVPLTFEGHSEDVLSLELRAFRTNRQKIAIGYVETDILFRRHFITRLLERDFLSGKEDPTSKLKEALVDITLTGNLLNLDNRRHEKPIVCPVGDGLALGVAISRDHRVGATGRFALNDRNYQFAKYLTEQGERETGYINTYIARKDMYPDQIAVWEMLRDFTAKHRENMIGHLLETCFWSHSKQFDSKYAWELDRIDAIRDYIEITKTPEWKGFENMNRKGILNDVVQKSIENTISLTGSELTGLCLPEDEKRMEDEVLVRKLMDKSPNSMLPDVPLGTPSQPIEEVTASLRI